MFTEFTDELLPGPRFVEGPPPDIHLALFDVDNTLVPNNDPSLPSDDFIATVQGVGTGAVGLATARQPQKALHIIEAANLRGLSILSNGAQIYNGLTGEMVVERPLHRGAAGVIIDTLQLLGVEHWIQDDGVDHRWIPDAENVPGQHMSLADHGPYAYAANIWEPAEGSNRLIVPQYEMRKPFVIVAHDVDPEKIETIRAIGEQHEDDGVTTLIAHQNEKPDGTMSYEVFFVDKRANKLTAVDEVAEITGIPVAHMMAVGDGPNDAAIVGYVGVGVAMGNAVQETLDVAMYITPSVEQDGAAIALASLMLQ
jgi:hydroxymethylpyrimidine pyrophosphatase-like HAD family hydrolase